MHVVNYGYQKEQEMEMNSYKTPLFFSVKSLSVKTHQVSEVEFFRFHDFSLHLKTRVIKRTPVV